MKNIVTLSHLILIICIVCTDLVACDSWSGPNNRVRSVDNVPDIPGTLSLIAGNIEGPGYADGLGVNAQFGPAESDIGLDTMGIASDVVGNLYVADISNHVIRKINVSGVVTTIAGKAGSPGSADGVATNARFNNPNRIALDIQGNLYISDSANYTIRKITPQGVVSTLAGKAGVQGFVDGIGIEARFGFSKGIAVNDRGVIYITDSINNTIREINPNGVVHTIAGNFQKHGFSDGTGSSALFFRPEGIAIDRFGNLYVGDSGNQSIRKITPLGMVSTFLGAPHAIRKDVDGPLVSAQILRASGIGIDHVGNIYVTDVHAIRKISTDGMVSTIAGNNSMVKFDELGRVQPFSNPSEVAVDNADNLYIADDSLIRRVNSSGDVVTVAGQEKKCNSKDGIGAQAQFCGPVSLTADEQGNLYVTEAHKNVIRKISLDGTVTTVAGTPNTQLYVPEQRSVARKYADGLGSSAEFSWPSGIVADPIGNLYVSDKENHVIRKIGRDGRVTTIAGIPGKGGWVDGVGEKAQFFEPLWIVMDKKSNLYVMDAAGQTIRKIDSASTVITFAGDASDGNQIDGKGINARFDQAVSGMTIDSSENLYVADGNSIRKIDPTGMVTTLGNYSETLSSAQSEKISHCPEGIAADKMGNLYYSVHSKIRKINTKGDIIAEIKALGGNEFGLGGLSVLPNPKSLVFLDDHTIAMISGDAVLKLKFP